jgi:hypothetical protein
MKKPCLLLTQRKKHEFDKTPLVSMGSTQRSPLWNWERKRKQLLLENTTNVKYSFYRWFHVCMESVLVSSIETALVPLKNVVSKDSPNEGTRNHFHQWRCLQVIIIFSFLSPNSYMSLIETGSFSSMVIQWFRIEWRADMISWGNHCYNFCTFFPH